MKERPILFSSPMVRSILEGRKTQTRRIIKPQPGQITPAGRPLFFQHGDTGRRVVPICPYGAVGDRLWGRETVRAIEETDGRDVVEYLADNHRIPISGSERSIIDWLDMLNYSRKKNAGLTNPNPGKTVPSIHMPRWASRITLEITGVRVERLNEISERDVEAEGWNVSDPGHGAYGARWFYPGRTDRSFAIAQDAFAFGWESISGAGSWDLNPFVWVIEFKRVQNV